MSKEREFTEEQELFKAIGEDEASEKWARDNAEFVPNDQSEGMLYKSFLAGIEWQKNRIMPNTTNQPNNISNESIEEDEERCNILKIRNYFVENDKTPFEHWAFDFLNKFYISYLNIKQPSQDDDLDYLTKYPNTEKKDLKIGKKDELLPKTIDEDELVEKFAQIFLDNPGNLLITDASKKCAQVAKDYSSTKLEEIEKWIDEYKDPSVMANIFRLARELKEKIKSLHSQ